MQRIVAAIMLAAAATGAQAYEIGYKNLSSVPPFTRRAAPDAAPIFLSGGQEMLWVGWANVNNSGHVIYRSRLDGSEIGQQISPVPVSRWFLRVMFLLPGEERLVYVGPMNANSEEHLYSITVNSVTPAIRLSLPLVSSTSGVAFLQRLGDQSTFLYRQSAAGSGIDWYQVPGDGSATALNWRTQLPAPYPYTKTIADLMPSPNGRYFGFESNAESTSTQVFAVPADFSRNPTMLSDATGSPSGIVGFSGDRVVFEQKLPVGNPLHVFSRNANGTGAAVRLSPNATNNTSFASFTRISPDGRYVLTLGPYATAGVTELWATPVAGGTVRRLTTFTHNAANVFTSAAELVFTQDGNSVIYRADADVDFLMEPWIARLDGSEPPRRIAPPGDPGYFVYNIYGLSNDGLSVLYSARANASSPTYLYSMRLDGTGSPNLISRTAEGPRSSDGSIIRLLPDGERLLFQSRAAGSNISDLMLGHVDGSAPATQISPPFTSGYGVRGFWIVPETNQIVFRGFDNTTDFESIMTVVATPTMAEFAPIVTDNRGLPIGPLALELSDLETPADQIVVTATSSNQALLPDAALQIDKVGGEQFLTLRPVEAAHGDALVTLVASDDDANTTTTLLQLTVQNTYQRPTLAPIAAEASEDTPITIGPGDFAAAFTHPQGHALERLRIDSLPAAGTLRHGGLEVHAGDVLTTPAIALEYTAPANFSGTEHFLWNATDGVFFADGPSSATLTLRPVDDPPALVQQPTAPPLSDDGATTFTLVSFGLVDPDSPLDAIQIHVTDGPTSGTLTPPTDFTLGQVDNGQVGYEFHGETHAPAQDSFRFRWTDPAKPEDTGEATYIIDIPAGTNVRDRWIID